MNYIKLFEYEKLRISKSKDGLSKYHFETLVKFNERNKNKYFDIIHNGIVAKNYVGIIKINDLTLEILPKTINEELDYLTSKKLLYSMLKLSKTLPIDQKFIVNLKHIDSDPLILYFIKYLEEIERLIHLGFIKKYRFNESNQKALKGNLIFKDQIKFNLIRADRFYCKHTIYSNDNQLNRILKYALVLCKNALGNEYKQRVNHCLLYFDKVKDVVISKEQFKLRLLNRKSFYLESALEFSKIIILKLGSNLDRGQTNLFSLLFDMNLLWELYIFNILKKYQIDYNYKISYQNSKLFWNTKKIKPDLILVYNDINYVIDTKWKIIMPSKPNDDDLKQMFVYNEYWSSSKSLLLYPYTKYDDTDWVIYKNKNQYCKIGFLRLVKDKILLNHSELNYEILSKFNIIGKQDTFASEILSIL